MAHLMIVEDDKLLRTMTAHAAEAAGHTVSTADCGTSAMRLLNDARLSPVDLVITDILMPDMDGLELIRAIKASRPDLKIVAVSAGSSQMPMNFLGVAEMFGADRVVAKPIAPQVLLQQVADLVPSQS